MVQQPAPAAQSTQPQQPAPAAQPAHAAQPVKAAQVGEPEKKKSKQWIWTIAILFAILVGVVIGFFIRKFI